MRYRVVVPVALLAACAAPARPGPAPAPPAPPRVALHIDAEEARAVLAMLDAPSEAAWQRVASSAGYKRLAIREHGMGRSFEDADMRAFIATPELAAKKAALAETVTRWSAVDLDAVAARILPYLPAEATLAATIYPVIKPRSNSFVNFDQDGAAIFLYVDPERTAAEFDNTVAHELHHIGFHGLSTPACTAAAPVCAARTWTGGFGEGFAMLAAAGGPDIHPHRTSPAADRERWDRDVARFDADLTTVEAFFQDVLAGKLDEAAQRERVAPFYGVQGPWYTLGWSMAVAIERCFGRTRLVEAMRAPWTVLGLYNTTRARCSITTPHAAQWSADLVRALE